MKVTPLETQIPFSQKRFNVELTGLELALLSFYVNNSAVGSDNSLGGLASEVSNDIDRICCSMYDKEFPAIPIHKIILKEFTQKIDDLNK